MPYTVTIDGVDVGATLLRPGKVGAQFSIETALNGSATASFALRQSATGTLTDSVDAGDAVVITDVTTGNVVFGGQVTRIRTEQINHNPSGTYYTVHRLTCADWSSRLKQRLVNAAYSGDTLATIVADINTNYLNSDGFDVSGVTLATVITRAGFGQVVVASAFDTLAKMAGVSWWVDANRVVYFQERVAASTILTFSAASRPYLSISREKTLAQYANVVIQKGGLGTTASRVESLIGDGTRRVFNLAYPVSAKPTTIVAAGITIASGDIGIRGLETGKKWYWSKGSTEIEQDSAETVLSSVQTLVVTYTGLYPIVIQAEDAAEIAARVVASPGTSGRYEVALTDTSIENLTEAAEKAAGHLARYGELFPVVTFVIDGEYVYPGAMVSITLPEMGLAGDYLIERVSWTDRGDGELRATVTAVGGMARDGWEAWWRRQTGKEQDAVTDTLITQLQSATALLSFTATVAATEVTGSSRFLVYGTTAASKYSTHEYGYA